MSKGNTTEANKPRLHAASASNGILHPKLDIYCHEGNEAITVALAKEILGWETEEMYVKQELEKITDEKKRAKANPSYGNDFLLKDEFGNKVRCLNNEFNRKYEDRWARRLAQDILTHNWSDSRNGGMQKFQFNGKEIELPEETLNGETIIIGRTGRVLSGQHRLIALVLAWQLYSSSQKAHWQAFWSEEPTIEGIIVYGVSESPRTTRTLDNVKPRKLEDVLFADEQLFGKTKIKEKDRGVLCRMVEHTVRFLWSRTPCDSGRRKNNAFAPQLTHSEAIEFVDRHPRIKKAVMKIFEEYSAKDEKSNSTRWKVCSERCPPGTAAGLLYLMGCTESDHDTYVHAKEPGDKNLKWGMWDKACEFWTYLCSGHADVREVHHALAALHEGGRIGGPTRDEKVGTIIKGWAYYAEGEPFKARHLKLKTKEDENGLTWLDEWPLIPGIDIGPKDPEDQPSAKDPTPEDIAAEKERIKNENLNGSRDENRTPRKKKEPKIEAEVAEEEVTEEEFTEALDKEDQEQAAADGEAQTEEEMLAEQEAATGVVEEEVVTEETT